MYYSALVVTPEEKERLLFIAASFNIELRVLMMGSVGGQVLWDNLQDAHVEVNEFPLVLAGYEVIGEGDEAWQRMYNHSLANPHQHWEADQDDG